jgi:hypothetical protein
MEEIRDAETISLGKMNGRDRFGHLIDYGIIMSRV